MSASGGADRCVTCADEGIPMRVLALRGDGALCADAREALHERIALELVEPVAVGDRVLVHAGVAIARLAEGA